MDTVRCDELYKLIFSVLQTEASVSEWIAIFKDKGGKFVWKTKRKGYLKH